MCARVYKSIWYIHRLHHIGTPGIYHSLFPVTTSSIYGEIKPTLYHAPLKVVETLAVDYIVLLRLICSV